MRWKDIFHLCFVCTCPEEGAGEAGGALRIAFRRKGNGGKNGESKIYGP